MIRSRERVFVDTGAWIALAVVRDPLHEKAREQWDLVQRSNASVMTSIPVTIETFTYLDRKGSRDLAARWSVSLKDIPRFKIVGCSPPDLEKAWEYFDRKEFHKLSLTDATSFVLMQKHGARIAFTFDVHFGIAGFRFVS